MSAPLKADRALILAAAKALYEEAKVTFTSNVDCYSKRIEDRAVHEQYEHYRDLVRRLRLLARRLA